MKPKKYPHADISKKANLFFAIGLAVATSVSLFAIENKNISTENQLFNKFEITNQEKPPVSNDTIPYKDVDEVPRFEIDKDLPNERETLDWNFKKNIDKHVEKNKYYPQHAEQLITGRVIIQFCIDTNGYVTITGIRGHDKSLEAEARRIMEKLPKLIPAKHEGKNVNCIYTYPIMFKLE